MLDVTDLKYPCNEWQVSWGQNEQKWAKEWSCADVLWWPVCCVMISPICCSFTMLAAHFCRFVQRSAGYCWCWRSCDVSRSLLRSCRVIWHHFLSGQGSATHSLQFLQFAAVFRRLMQICAAFCRLLVMLEVMCCVPMFVEVVSCVLTSFSVRSGQCNTHSAVFCNLLQFYDARCTFLQLCAAFCRLLVMFEVVWCFQTCIHDVFEMFS